MSSAAVVLALPSSFPRDNNAQLPPNVLNPWLRPTAACYSQSTNHGQLAPPSILSPAADGALLRTEFFFLKRPTGAVLYTYVAIEPTTTGEDQKEGPAAATSRALASAPRLNSSPPPSLVTIASYISPSLPLPIVTGHKQSKHSHSQGGFAFF